EFVVGIVVDVLRHVVVNRGEQGGVGGIAAAAGDFAGVGNTAEFVVLHPKIGFENFRGGRETEQGGVAFAQSSWFDFVILLGKCKGSVDGIGAEGDRAGGESFLEKAASRR